MVIVDERKAYAKAAVHTELHIPQISPSLTPTHRTFRPVENDLFYFLPLVSIHRARY